MNATDIFLEYLEKRQPEFEAELINDTVIFEAKPVVKKGVSHQQKLGLAFLIIALGGLIAAFSPIITIEAKYQLTSIKDSFIGSIRSVFAKEELVEQSEAKPTLTYDPMKANDGSTILPINTDFAIIVPKLGINATVIPGVNPSEKKAYTEALKKGVAHASTSFYPNENGATYLFSHSTNYEWFVEDLNAIFYLLKDLEEGDLIVILYMGHRYTYEMRSQKIVSPRDITYLQPISNRRMLILQTCWPPGTVSKRMLIFADLIDERPYIPTSN